MITKKNYQKKIEIGLAFFKNTNYLQGLKVFKEVEKLENKDFLVYWYLGHTHFKLYNYNKAIECIKKSIELKSEDTLNLNFLAKLYFSNNQYEKAILILEKLLRLDNANKEALISLAKINTDKGNFKEAIKNYFKILENDPNNFGIYYELIKLNKENLTKDLISKIKKELNIDKISNENKIFANLILAINEKLNKDYKLQINYSIKSHSIFLKEKKIASKQEWNYFSNLLPQFIKKNNKNEIILDEADVIRPIFIMGLPRSGTTLVENIIGNGSMKLPMGGEIESISKVFYSQNIIENYNSLNLKTNFGFKKDDYNELRKNIINHYDQAKLIDNKKKNMFTDKSLENFLYIDIITKIFPNSKFVYCQRDPLANILGIFDNFLPNLIWTHSIDMIFQYFDIYYKKLSEILKKNNLNFKIINLEEISSEPKKTSKDLYDFLELEWSEDSINFNNNNNIIKTASNIQLRKKIVSHDLDYLIHYVDIFKDFGKEYNWYNY